MRPRLSHFFGGLITTLAVFMASPSQGGQIYGLTDFHGSGSVGVTISKPTGGTEGTLSNDFTTSISTHSNGSPVTKTYDTYCIDIYHNNNGAYGNGAGWQEVKLIVGNTFSAAGRDTGYGTASTAYELQGLGRAAWFVNNTSALAALTSGVLDKAALQLAIWKAEYEGASDSVNYDKLGSGTISFSGINSSSQVWKDATKYLQASLHGGHTYSTSTAIWLSYQGGAQDQITALPEPASLAMSGTALLAVSGLVLRRRKARVQA